MSSTSTQCLHLRSNRTTVRVAGILKWGKSGMLAFVLRLDYISFKFAQKTETDELLTIQATPRAGTLERDGVVERQVAPVGERV